MPNISIGEKKPDIYRGWYYLQFQASTSGLGLYPLHGQGRATVQLKINALKCRHVKLSIKFRDFWNIEAFSPFSNYKLFILLIHVWKNLER